MPVVVVRQPPTTYPPLTFATPRAFVMALQERLGLPQTGVWDAAFVTEVASRLRLRPTLAPGASLLEAGRDARGDVSVAQANAAAWVLDTTLRIAPPAGPGVSWAPSLPGPNSMSVTGWEPFPFGTAAPESTAAAPATTTGAGAAAPPTTPPKEPSFLGTTGGKIALGAGVALLAWWAFKD